MDKGRKTMEKRRMRRDAYRFAFLCAGTLLFISLGIFLTPSRVIAGNYYIRAGATGANNGNDWANAFSDFPSTMARGATYYVASGSYGPHTFNTLVSGTAVIVIKKATIDDHGTDTGWNNSYGDGQAVFANQIMITTDYWLFDGQTRTSLTSGHGFKIDNNSAPVDDPSIVVGNPGGPGGGTPANNITIRYVEVAGSGDRTDTYNDSGVYAVGNLQSNITFSHLYIHDNGGTNFKLENMANVLIEHTYMTRNHDSAAVHSEGIAARTITNFTVRYNYFVDIEGTAHLTTPGGSDGVGANWYIYGNVFMRTPGNPYGISNVGDGAIYFLATQISGDILIYNNTVVNLNYGPDNGGPGQFALNRTGNDLGNVQVKNNLWYNSFNAYSTCDTCDTYGWSYNAYFDTLNTADPDPNKQSASGDPFVDWRNGNVALTGATMAGASLPAPYNLDANGQTRGADGAWDRGAFEYVPLHYVRADALAGGDGSDWDKAWQQLPATLQRGHVYYIADGAYGSYTFDDAVSGTTPIYIKKATVADHGTDAGWQDLYGDGQAVFAGQVQFCTDYWLFDGQTRTSLTSGHGFKIDKTLGLDEAASLILGSPYADGVTSSGTTIRYVEIEGSGDQSGVNYDPGVQATRSLQSDITFSYMYIHDVGNVHFKLETLKNVVIEHTYMTRNQSNPTQHSEAVAWRNVDGFTLRYCYMVDIEGTAIISNPGASSAVGSNWAIYGNVFARTPGNPYGIDAVGNGAIHLLVVTVDNVWIYNNTVYNLNYGPDNGGPGRFSLNRAGNDLGNVWVQNNLWFNSFDSYSACSSCDSLVWTHNAYFDTDSTDDPDPNKQVGTGSPFVDWQNRNLTLTGATMAGASLSSPYNTDPSGLIRGADGVWDRGAYEFVSQSIFFYGDVSENGTVSAYDASLAAQYAVGLITLTSNQITKADVSGNGSVSAYDASLIAQKAVGLIEKFPVEG